MTMKNSCVHRRVHDMRNSDVIAVFGSMSIQSVCEIGESGDYTVVKGWRD